MTLTTVCEGDWRYSKQVWHGTFTATNVATGDSHDTGARDMPGARAFVAQFTPARPTAAVTFTIASGPQRARAGHQRFPNAQHFE